MFSMAYMDYVDLLSAIQERLLNSLTCYLLRENCIFEWRHSCYMLVPINEEFQYNVPMILHTKWHLKVELLCTKQKDTICHWFF